MPSRSLEAGEVRIKVRAVGLTYPDVLMVAGRYQHKPPLPFVPGAEAAGEVVEIASDVQQLSVGDRVIARPRDGAYREEIVAPAGHVRRMPDRFDFAQGATFLSAYGTAHYGLVERAAIRGGEILLVHGAAGGVGLAAVELGKAYGATVIAMASSPEKVAVLTERGADHILQSGEPFRDKVKALTSQRGADIVFDPVGGPALEESVRCLNWGARVVVVGFLQGVGLAKTNLLLIKNASLLGIRSGEALRRDPAIGEARMRDLYTLAEARKIIPYVSHVLPMEQWADGMRLLIDRRAIGRVALIATR